MSKEFTKTTMEELPSTGTSGFKSTRGTPITVYETIISNRDKIVKAFSDISEATSKSDEKLKFIEDRLTNLGSYIVPEVRAEYEALTDEQLKDRAISIELSTDWLTVEDNKRLRTIQAIQHEREKIKF